MKRLITLIFCLLCFLSHGFADALDSLQSQLLSHPQIQEKVYIHTDNNCYFLGDTLWYKAYVLRSDDLHFTDMSKILYVELLNPDGLVVQRQQVVISNKGYTNGDFVLQDSLYSGYYELRAYTRWNLNFNVSHRQYSIDDRQKFYNNAMAKDFFRQWEGLYSRVIPVYEKPKVAGDYDNKYIVNRPKEDLMAAPSPKLQVHFYPEGGSLISGVKSRVAFEVTDQEGKAVDITGKLSDGTVLKTQFMGRGVFEMTPAGQQAAFTWNGKDYKFDLPHVTSTGVAIRLEGNQLSLNGNAAAFAVLCRGRLMNFQRIEKSGRVFELQMSQLPTGINEVVVFDSHAHPVASRLFFVNHQDMSVPLTVKTDKLDYQPYEPIHVDVKATVQVPTTISVSVRDKSTEDFSYDDGNMLTDLLLSSELKGFIANPAYYFEKDDATHQQALDLLMMVQGWRRYDRVEDIRYMPEKTLTVDGTVYPLLNVAFTEQNEVYNPQSFQSSTETDIANAQNMTSTSAVDMSGMETDTSEESSEETNSEESTESTDETVEPVELGVNHGGIREEVLVEAEIEKGGQSAGLVEKTSNHGHFMFQIPAFYGQAVLFIKAYNVKDSLKKNMASSLDKDWMNERAYPDYYVKRDLFFPVYSNPYSWYQIHQPDNIHLLEDDIAGGATGDSKLAGEHQLQTVKVVASTRTRRGIKYSKPALVFGVYDLYNDVTDYGLSYGIFQMNRFPVQVAQYLYGNFGRRNQTHIRAMIDGTSFFRNYTQTNQEFDRNQTTTAVFSKMLLGRLQDVKVYSDYELRSNNGLIEHQNSPAVTFDFQVYPDEGKSYAYRDRRLLLNGFTRPDEFYNPDYSKQTLQNATDYRRTLYWNPNVPLNTDGSFQLNVFNNSKKTRVKVSVAGMTQDGKVLLCE